MDKIRIIGEYNCNPFDLGTYKQHVEKGDIVLAKKALQESVSNIKLMVTGLNPKALFTPPRMKFKLREPGIVCGYNFRDGK